MSDASAELKPLSATPRTRLRRYPDRVRTDRAELYEVLDSALLCFLGTVVDGAPRVLPMVYGRIDDTLYIHGSVANQALLAVKNGALCADFGYVAGEPPKDLAFQGELEAELSRMQFFLRNIK